MAENISYRFLRLSILTAMRYTMASATMPSMYGQQVRHKIEKPFFMPCSSGPVMSN